MIPFIDLNAQQQQIRADIDRRISAVLDHGRYIMGPEIDELEAQLAGRAGAKYAISCSSGTDALILGLLGLELKPGQGVIVPSFTFAASAEAIAVLGAIPVFAEVSQLSFNLDADRLDQAFDAAQQAGIEVVGIMAVGLFGQPADMDALAAQAEDRGVWLLDDAAQSFGANWRGRMVGSLADVTATSFFPAKPLGCYGDGGALFTDNDRIAEIAKSCRVHGQGRDKYENERIGMTGRMDTIQAAILLSKLTIFDDELIARQKVADRYCELLSDLPITCPSLCDGASSSWAQYVVTLSEGYDRAELQSRLADSDIPTAIYYPRPMHTQPPYLRYPRPADSLAVTEQLADSVLALPMHPYLDESEQDKVCSALHHCLK